jgi:uncharacterized protein
MPKAVVHFEIAGPDAKALEAFYKELFGWTTDSDNPMNYTLVFPMTNGIGGGIAPAHETPYVTFYVATDDDVAGTLAKAVDLGGSVVMEPRDAGPGAPTIAMFADPDGNQIGLAGGTGEEVSTAEGTGAPVSWFEIAGRDGEKTQVFYRDLFGWEIDAENEMKYGQTQGLAKGIGGGIYGDEQPGVRIYVAVDDLDATLEKAEKLGGKTVMEPTDVPGGPRIALFNDPAGNGIGLLIPMSG